MIKASVYVHYKCILILPDCIYILLCYICMCMYTYMWWVRCITLEKEGIA